MATAKEIMLSTAKTLLGIADTTKDVILNHYINVVYQSIIDYCNRSDFPDELIPFVTSKVVALYNDRSAATASGNGSLKSIKSGDVSYGFAGDDVNRGFAGVGVGELTAGEKSQLSRHRLLGFK